jgi:hypothetical protein
MSDSIEAEAETIVKAVTEEVVKTAELLEAEVVKEIKSGWCIPLFSWFRRGGQIRSLILSKPAESESTKSK